MVEGLLDEPIEYTNAYVNPLTRQGAVVTVCYNQATVWKSRKAAAAFYREGVMACDGCERERYMNVLLDILDGNAVCDDGVTSLITREVEYR